MPIAPGRAPVDIREVPGDAVALAAELMQRRGASSPSLRRRWKIERLFAELQNYRHPTVRWEYRLDNFLGMLHFGLCPLWGCPFR
jgi:hypothetical protein